MQLILCGGNKRSHLMYRTQFLDKVFSYLKINKRSNIIFIIRFYFKIVYIHHLRPL